jgi:hypothetical protein
MNVIKTGSILQDVMDERLRQDAKWGEQNHDDPVWAAILGEEVGEACKATLERAFGWDGGIDTTSTPSELLRAELVQVAAVAVAWIERIDRRLA